jgi:two-component system, NarL family, sensor kinase
MFEAKQEIKFAVILGTCLLVILILVVILAISLYRTRQAKYMEETENLRSKFQQELLQAQLEIQEQTLKNISQEIHDNIGQTLSLAKLNLNTIDLHKENAQDKIVNSKELVSKAIHDLRNLSRSLNTDSVLSSGLLKAIETELVIINHAGSFTTGLKTKGQSARIDSKKELILFRIVQEAINNIIKHSDANSIIVTLDFTNALLRIEINDNGKGFEANTESNEGQGLRNMKSRAELIGGNFEILSGANGTTITITLPITES